MSNWVENPVEREMLLRALETAHRLAILRAGEAIGYARVMQIASDAWRHSDPMGALHEYTDTLCEMIALRQSLGLHPTAHMEP